MPGLMFRERVVSEIISGVTVYPPIVRTIFPLNSFYIVNLNIKTR